jgi:hypothetical protein
MHCQLCKWDYVVTLGTTYRVTEPLSVMVLVMVLPARAKPVHRRILFALHDMGLTATSQPSTYSAYDHMAAHEPTQW